MVKYKIHKLQLIKTLKNKGICPFNKVENSNNYISRKHFLKKKHQLKLLGFIVGVQLNKISQEHQLSRSGAACCWIWFVEPIYSLAEKPNYWLGDVHKKL